MFMTQPPGRLDQSYNFAMKESDKRTTGLIINSLVVNIVK